eukprot:3349148-Pyramimonas_sp.AAC.1
MTSATLFTDLRKFYERIAHSVLVREGLATGFEYRILAAARSLHAGPGSWLSRVRSRRRTEFQERCWQGVNLATSLVKVLLYRT